MVSIALIGPGVDLVLDGANEAAMLEEIDDVLRRLPAGVLVTWNGGSFDLPFLATRAAATGVKLGLTLEFDPSIPGRLAPLPGHPGAYRGRWHQHGHLDGYQLFRADVGRTLSISCGLKPLARFMGLPVVEVDRERIHDLDAAALRRYVASDAGLARQLVERRPGADSWIDQLSASG